MAHGPGLIRTLRRLLPAAAARLGGVGVVARERRAELALCLGSAGDAVADLQAIVAEHPDRERAWGLLMQALYQGGRPTDARFTCWSRRGHLPDDPGPDSSSAVARIEHDIPGG